MINYHLNCLLAFGVILSQIFLVFIALGTLILFQIVKNVLMFFLLSKFPYIISNY